MVPKPKEEAKEYDLRESGVLNEADAETPDGDLKFRQKAQSGPRKYQLVWKNIIWFIFLHISAVYGIWLMITSAQWKTTIFAFGLYYVSGLGITAGVHRLWAHRAFKANLPLRIILMIFNTIAFQDSVYHWSRDHRLHHKFTETNSDPHNASRGFFYSHVGWLVARKDPQVIAAGKKIDMSDLEQDKVLMFQHKYYLILMPIFCFILPTITPYYLWGETLKNSWYIATMFRYAFVLNLTWLINSAAHIFGAKPYDKDIRPVDNNSVAVLALGEGFHNYHHVFPWDYKAAELGNYSFNFTTAFIDFFAKIGWAYDLKTVSPDMILKRVARTGDGNHESQRNAWGWNDASEEDKEMATIQNKKE